MQNQTSAAMAWARFGWRRIVLIAASIALAFALLASLGTSSGTVSADADTGETTEQVALPKWKEVSTDDGWAAESSYLLGPSWT